MSSQRSPVPQPEKVEPLRFVSIRVSDLLSMTPAELDYLDGLAGEEKRDWIEAWRAAGYGASE